MEKTVTIPAREHERLLSLERRVAQLQEQLAWCQRQIFGQKSERLIDNDSTPGLPGFEMPAPEPEPEAVQVSPHKRKGKRGKGSCTVQVPDDLPRVKVLIDVPETERILPDGTALVKIGEDRSEKLAFRPGEYYMKVFVRPKYAAPANAKLGVVQEPMPGSLIEGSKFDTSFMAHVVEEKFAFHMPLYRIEEKLATRDILVTRQTLCQLIRNCGERIIALVDLMYSLALAQGFLFTDDTPIKVQWKGKCREGRIWVYIGAGANAPPYHIYRFTMDRGHRHPIEHLKDFKGIFHADAFQAYEKLHAASDNDISWAACWAHARRKFENAQTQASLRDWVLQKMRYLFLFERVAWKSDDAKERLAIRRDHELSIVDEIYARLRLEVAAGELLPKSAMAQAIGYMLTREENFRIYLDHADIHMDNNTAERGLRKLTIGRKNWLFIGNEKSGKAMVALLSLVQTCRAMNIKPRDYLEDIFNRIMDHPANQLEDLLPDQWAKQSPNE